MANPSLLHGEIPGLYFVKQVLTLTGELVDEALRRLDRAQEALENVWKHEQAAKKASHARKEGV